MKDTMENNLTKSLSAHVDFLLSHRYRKIGKLVLILSIPGLLLLNTLLMRILNLDLAYWKEWNSYLLHVPLSLGLYLILFSKEKNEDEFYLSLRLRSIARGVILIVVATASLPLLANLGSLIVERAVRLPDMGGNMAVCTLLLVYANVVYAYNKFLVKEDD